MSAMAIPILIFLINFFIYAYTAPPGVVGGDSGELMAMACAGGVAHPPGYPLLTVNTKCSVALLPPYLL